MNKKSLLILTLVIVFVGGAFLAWKSKERSAEISKEEVKTDTTSSTIDTSDWKTYKNEKLGFEFKYPSKFDLNIDAKKNSNWGDENELLEEITLNKNSKNVIWIVHTKAKSKEIFLNHLKEVDALSQKKGEGKILKKNEEMKINNIEAFQIEYCSYSVAGVNCDLIKTALYFPLEDGTFISFRMDPFWSSKEEMEAISEISKTFVISSH